VAIKDVLYSALRASPIGPRLAHIYPYNFKPHQLCAILGLVSEVLEKHPTGEFVEVGCCQGYTSIFLSTHVATAAPSGSYLYQGYDTFAGFEKDDIDFELVDRGLGLKRDLYSGFQRNRQDWVQQSVDRNRAWTIPIQLMKANATTHDFAEVKQPIFILIDVDVFKPTENALHRLWPRLLPGGVVVLDDCSVGADGMPDLKDKFSGGHAALLEFVKDKDIPIAYLADKLAVIRKPA